VQAFNGGMKLLILATGQTVKIANVMGEGQQWGSVSLVIYIVLPV